MRRPNLVSVSVSIIILGMQGLMFGQDIPPDSNGRAQAIRLLQTVAANWRGLENYDVAVVHERWRIEDDQETERMISRMRLIADHVHHRYLFVETGSLNDGPTYEQAFFLDVAAGEGWRQVPVGEPAVPTWIRIWKPDADESKVNEGLKASGFPDVRLVGTSPYPFRFSTSSIDQYFAKGFNFGPDTKTIPLGDDSIEVVENILLGKVTRFQRRYTFDGAQPAPTHLVFSNRLRTDTRPLDKNDVAITNDEAIKWKEIKGVFLPIEVRGRSRSRPGAEPRKYIVTFEWLAVNDADKLPQFDVSLLSDDQTLSSFVPEN